MFWQCEECGEFFEEEELIEVNGRVLCVFCHETVIE